MDKCIDRRLDEEADQDSSFITDPRLIWTRPYTRQLTDRTENWKQYETVIVVYRGGSRLNIKRGPGIDE